MEPEKKQSDPLHIDFSLGGEERSEVWMISFADLLSLILTFFILVYAMTELQKGKWDPVKKSFDDRFKVKSLSPSNAEIEYGVERINVPKAVNLDYLYAVLQQKFMHYPDVKEVTIQRLEDRILISLPTVILFDEGAAVITPQAEELILTIGEIVQLVSNDISVAGNTDQGSVATLEYPSNWELSLARAVTVAEILKRAGTLSEIKAYGLADSQYKYLPEGLSRQEKDTLARRIDIVIREAQATSITSQISSRLSSGEAP